MKGKDHKSILQESPNNMRIDAITSELFINTKGRGWKKNLQMEKKIMNKRYTYLKYQMF